MRTLRKRPDSRLSLVDDLWDSSFTRHQSSNFTDDTSLDPSAPNPWGGLSSLAEAGADADEGQVRELSAKLADYEAQLPALQAADSAVEKAQLEHAVAMMSLEVKRLVQERSKGAFHERSPVFEPEVFSARAIRLAQLTLAKWKAHKTLGLAEKVRLPAALSLLDGLELTPRRPGQQILKSAVLIKEANVLSRRLQKDGASALCVFVSPSDTDPASWPLRAVTYNFIVADAAPLSALNDFLDVDDAPPSAAPRSELYIKVLDFPRNGASITARLPLRLPETDPPLTRLQPSTSGPSSTSSSGSRRCAISLHCRNARASLLRVAGSPSCAGR